MTKPHTLPPNIKLSGKIRFIVDDMLGRLAKWLRIVGYDTAYFRSIEDGALIKLALQENRIIITRDTLLIKRKLAKNSILIKNDAWKEQLSELTEKIPLDLKSHILSRCIICNHMLLPIEKEKVKEKVPQYIYKTQDQFVFCNRCHKVFWTGTHVLQIKKTLQNIKLAISN